MAKNVFRAQEIKNTFRKVYIQPPEEFAPQLAAQELEEVEEYTGPTVEDLRRDAEEFQQQWEQEKEGMLQRARDEADRIVKDAERVAFQEVKSKQEEAQDVKDQADAEAKRIVAEAEERAGEITRDAQRNAQDAEEEARRSGFEDGREKGFLEGRSEHERLVQRLHVIINKAIDRRNEIIEESESQIVNLVIQIAKKVVKVISENQRNVVVNNVVQALRKLKEKTDVVIRVNIEDLEMVTNHIQDIIDRVEREHHITVAEDSTVDPGGAIIETDFGEIDARIASQLQEIEDRILDLVPVKAKPRK
ncbi:MAG TPA: flagellar assembly protein FliH [Spirochaetia bacterium]|nr:flagellar assembly protein FliH [Spirochaetia bacterium]